MGSISLIAAGEETRLSGGCGHGQGKRMKIVRFACTLPFGETLCAFILKDWHDTVQLH